ncbi:hypothetical protein E2C01_092707 [Portunus trituberculatus]|uniref:Uncharacterized protein n=1 Tax=Portunus trituberculatus TaxID=210409 RepID=A0A5B7JYF4_PORTR|nr:hypothetical protein [Portunus trituberculatus]
MSRRGRASRPWGDGQGRHQLDNATACHRDAPQRPVIQLRSSDVRGECLSVKA